jgi:hypothetical protein
MKTFIMVLLTKIIGRDIDLQSEDVGAAIAILGVFGFILYLVISKLRKK